MKLYLHLAESGLSLSDLSLRVYEGGSPISLPSITLSVVSLSGTDYTLDGIPSGETVGGLTLTFENPSGVFHAYRFGIADRQALSVIIPIREVFADPIDDLSIRLFKDGTEIVPDVGDVTQLNPDGEYSVSGWTSTPLNEQWSVRWIYNGLVYSHQWTGMTTTANVGTFYQSIRAMQSPIPYKVDGDNRQLFSCNFIATVVSPTSRFEEEIEEILKVGPGSPPIPFDELVYLGFKGSLPDDAGPFNVIIPTGGYEPDESHNTKRENRGLQIITCATDYEAARDRAESVWHYLDGLRSVMVTL